jgi:hypothetical protein
MSLALTLSRMPRIATLAKRPDFEEREEWANMAFPESGSYVVPDALDLVSIDREGNRVLYAETAIWMRHS